MSIDWFTFAAQIVNFLVLVGLLRYFLYGPIVRAMQQREQKVTQRLSDAEAAETEADNQRVTLEHEIESFRQQREELLAKAKDEADNERQSLLADARKEVNTRREHWMSTFERDQQDLTNQTRRTVQRMGFDAARQVIQQIAGQDLQKLVCRAFLEQLRTLDAEQRTAITVQLADSGNPVLVRTAVELDADDRKRIGDAIRHAFQHDSEVRFEVASALISGIEVDAGGYSLPWNAARTLNTMETNVA